MKRKYLKFKRTILSYGASALLLISCSPESSKKSKNLKDDQFQSSIEKFDCKGGTLQDTSGYLCEYIKGSSNSNTKMNKYLKHFSVSGQDNKYSEYVESYMTDTQNVEFVGYVKTKFQEEINEISSRIERLKERINTAPRDNNKLILNIALNISKKIKELEAKTNEHIHFFEDLQDNLNTIFESVRKDDAQQQSLNMDDEKFIKECSKEAKNAEIPKYPSYEELVKSKSTIEGGYGEYLVIDNDGNLLPQGYYSKVYNIIMSSPTADAAALRAKVKSSYPNVDIVWMPRTLYEMMVIKYIVKEEQRKGGLCKLMRRDNGYTYEDFYKENEPETIALCSEVCWHTNQIRLGDNIYTDENKNKAISKALSYKANQTIVCEYNVNNRDFLSGDKLDEILNNLVSFYRNVYGKNRILCKHERLNTMVRNSLLGSMNGFSNSSSDFGNCTIGSHKDLNLIKNAISLECSDITKGSYILYRGYNKTRKNSYLPSHFVKGPLSTPISISFGIGLFAGCVNDHGACAYDYYGTGRGMLAVVVSMNQDPKECPFYIPENYRAIDQLYYYGEFFHARGKLISDGSSSIDGVYTTTGYKSNILDNLNAKGQMTKFELCRGINYHLAKRSVELG